MKYDRLDLCCGPNKPKGYIGVDKGFFKYPKGEFVQADVNKRLPFEDGSFIRIRAWQAIEHLDNGQKVEFMAEVYRLLKTGGIFEAEWPPAMTQDGQPNLNFFNDPTHTAWWQPGTFLCFGKDWRSKDANCGVYEDGYGIATDLVVAKSVWVSNFNHHVELVKI